MRILAIDTALGLCSAGVMDSATDMFIASESLLMDRGHAEALMPLIERVIAKVEGGFGSIDKIAVSVGPGSFTGLRVGLSAARGIALGLEVPAVGITTLTAFTVPLIDGDERSLIVSAIDARHGHMYAQIVSGAGQVFRPPQIYAIEALIAAVKSRSVRVVGSGAAMLARALQMEGIHPEAVNQLDGPDLGWIARLGVSANPEFAPPTPVYLKAPDAHPQTNGRVSHV